MCKAKRTDTGEWVKGYLWQGSDFTLIIPHNLGIDYDEQSSRMKAVAYPVDKETLCKRCPDSPVTTKTIWENDVFEYEGETAIVRYGRYHNPFENANTYHVGFYLDWQNNCLRKDLEYWVNDPECKLLGNRFDSENARGR